MDRVENIKLLDNWMLYTLQEMLDAKIILSHLDGNHGELYPSKDEFVKNGVPYLSANCIVDDEIDFTTTKFLTQKRAASFKKGVAINDDVLFAHNATVGPVAILRTELDFVVLSTTLTYYRCNKKFLLPNYLRLYMISDFFVNQYTEVMRQATRNQVPITKQRTFFHLVPPLPEQQRIVTILDGAFAAIAKAKTNAEQNLKNARELFESYLHGLFGNKGEGWEEQLFGDCFKLKSGDNLTAKNMIEGEYPVFGGNGIAGYHNEFNLSGSNVIIGRVGALCGNVRHITQNIWLTDNAFRVVDFKFDFDNSFLTHLLNYIDLRSFARQAAQPVISNSSLKDVILNFPKSKKQQQTIVQKLNAILAETKKLEAIYQQKIDDLEELKKSILQKAFSGELVTEELAV